MGLDTAKSTLTDCPVDDFVKKSKIIMNILSWFTYYHNVENLLT